MAQVSETRPVSPLGTAVAKAGSRILILRLLPATHSVRVLISWAVVYSASPIALSSFYYATMNAGEPRRGPITWLWQVAFSSMGLAAMIGVIVCATIMRRAVPQLERLVATDQRRQEFADWLHELYGAPATQLVSSLAGGAVCIATLGVVAFSTTGVFTIGFPEYVSAAWFGFVATNGVYWAVRLPGFVSWFRGKKRLRFRAIDPARTPALVSLGDVVDTACAFGIVALFALHVAVYTTWATFHESIDSTDRWQPVLVAETVVFTALAVIVLLLIHAGRQIEAIVEDHVESRLAKLARRRRKLRKAVSAERIARRQHVEALYDRIKGLDRVQPRRRRRWALVSGFVIAVLVEAASGAIMALF
jgi:hypothetical protein